MAKMYPEQLPQSIVEYPKRSSEVKVYYALKNALSDDFEIYYSISWLNKSGNSPAREGEADFIILSKKLGCLVVEVKGGRISRDGDDWTTIDRNDEVIRLNKSPIKQAERSKYALKEKLEQIPDLRGEYIDIGYLVIFPSSGYNNAILGADSPREICIFADDMYEIGEKINSVFSYWKLQAMSQVVIDKLRQFLRPSFELKIPLIGKLFEEEQKIQERIV